MVARTLVDGEVIRAFVGQRCVVTTPWNPAFLADFDQFKLDEHELFGAAAYELRAENTGPKRSRREAIELRARAARARE